MVVDPSTDVFFINLPLLSLQCSSSEYDQDKITKLSILKQSKSKHFICQHTFWLGPNGMISILCVCTNYLCIQIFCYCIFV